MILLSVCLLLTSPSVQATQSEPFPLLEGLGKYHRAIKSANSEAVRYANQGIALLYGFQYAQAGKSFEESVRLDPNLVMGYWGIAASKGNNINNESVSAESSRAALQALAKAQALKAFGTPIENALVDAAKVRFDPSGPKPRLHLDRAYADAMRGVYANYPNDPDVASLCAESILNLRPWKQWTLAGKPEEGTEEVLGILRHALSIDRNHPQALHLWIHTIEGSKSPERSNAEANRLMDLQPNLTHMQHMPAHIYNRTGNWKAAIEANRKAIAVYKKLWWKQGENLDYAHGRHLLAYAAAMRGQSELALQNANQIFDGLSPEVLEKNAGAADYYHGMKSMFLVRFGRWKDILALPEPPDKWNYARAMRWEATGVAYAAMGNPTNARAAQAKFVAERDKSLASSKDESNRLVLIVAAELLEGEILIAEGKSKEGVDHLRLAVAAEDSIPYSEPPDWIQPTRHTLGAALVDAGRYAEAIPVYQEDLKQHPNNGWSLYGLFRAYTGLGRTPEATKAKQAYKVAWIDSDFVTTSSCMCLPQKKG